MIRARLLAIAAAVTALALAPGSAAAAPAPASRLLLSYDGATWAESLPPLFDHATVVPGDRLTTIIYVRNASADDATLTVEPEDVALYSASPDPFYDELTLSVGEKDSPSRPVAFSELEGAVLVQQGLPASEVAALAVDVTFPASATAGADARADGARFALRLSLAQDAATVPSEPGGRSGGGPGALPATGGVVNGGWWAIAALAAGAVILLLGRRRRGDAA